MNFSIYELIWLFFVYSFLGWIWETIVGAFKEKRFVNRGLISLPFCSLYGMASVFITVFGSELQGIWLYIGSVVMIVSFRWLAGTVIEKICHESWWDYSKRRWHMGKYVSLPDSAFWGFAAVAMMKWTNGFWTGVLEMIPRPWEKILIWGLLILLALDMLATLAVLRGNAKESGRLKKLDKSFIRFTAALSQKIYAGIEKRIKRAYPDASQVKVQEKKKTVFAYGCSFYKLVWLFVIGAFLGDLTETVFCRITMGSWMSRSSVVWGPFSIVWGLAIVMGTVVLHKYRDKSDRVIFFAGTVLGGAYEYICSVFTEIFFGKVFWDYSHIRFNLGGRINLLYCFFWGIAAVVWIKGLYPRISAWIEKMPVRLGKIVSWILVIFMCCNMIVSSMALIRQAQRAENVPAQYGWQRIMDERFDDARLERIYPNAEDK